MSSKTMVDKNMNITSVGGLNNFIDNDIKREAMECVEYFKEFEKNPRRRRRSEEAYQGWPLVSEKQVRYVKKKLKNIYVVEKDGMFLVKMIRKKDEDKEEGEE